MSISTLTAAVVAIVVAIAATVAGAGTDKPVFTRWGSRECPAGTSMLYEGIAAGGAHNHRGSGANALCLHGNNFQENTLPGSGTNNNDGGLLYGTEYQHTGSLDNNHDRDASCSVCQVDTPGEVYTQWGRAFGCSDGHTTMYNGYVMSSHYSQYRSEFVCVDRARDYHQRDSSGNQDGQLWYTVETEGGSMDEYLYPQDKEVGCSVCHAPRAVYTRWGSRSCAKGSTMMYEGVAAGSLYYHSGGGHNNLCLHNIPQTPLGWGGDNNGGLLYGVEYQNSGAIDKNHDKDAACAVCMADVEGHAYIQWGRSKSCSNNHVKLYSGFVLSERYNHYKGEFQCVDEERAFHARSSNADSNGALWYSTEVESGAMDESKYASNVEIGCSMCLAPKTTYVAWGATDCKKGSGKKLYTGFASSSHYNDRGGGANALCLHESPEVPVGASAGDQNGGRLFGTEYENTGQVDKNHDKDAACTVCELETAGKVYTQWGRSKDCSNEHYTLYQGIVMSNSYTQNKNEFVCVSTDRAFHAKSSNTDNNGNLWYTVEVEAGSMDEDVYQHNREIGCVVCVSDAVVPPTPWYEDKIFTDLTKKVDGHATSIATKETIVNVKTLSDKVNTKAATTALTALDTKVGKLETDLNAAIATGISGLKTQVDSDRKAFGDAMVLKVKTAFTDSSSLDLPSVDSRFDWSVLCNGAMDADECGETSNCTDATVATTCPVACDTCVVEKKKSAINTSDGKLTVKINQGEKLIIDNGYEDVVMTQTQVEDLVKAAVSEAFSTAASVF